MASPQLRFRRHLAACVLVLLAHELGLLVNLDELGQLVRLASLAPNGQLNGQPPTQQQAAAATARYSRIKLASAQATHPEQVYRYDTRDDLNLIGKLVAGVQDWMPVIDMNYTLNIRHSFDYESLDASVDDYYAERFASNWTFDELELMSVKAALRTAPIGLHTSWGYATRELARQGSLPVRDDDLCTAQLSHLTRRLEHALELGLKGPPEVPPATGSPAVSSPVANFEARQIYRTPDLELMRYMDSFGRVPSDVLRGNTKWYGAYLTCMNTRLRPFVASPLQLANQVAADKQAIKFRYCLAGLKSSSWQTPPTQQQQAREPDDYFLRLGVCLPEACDSTALERDLQQHSIERLAKFNLARPYNSDHYQLVDLYCLPDERSALRQIPLMGKLLLVLSACWLLLIGTATTIHLNVEKFYTRTVESLRHDDERRRNFLPLLVKKSPNGNNGNNDNEFHESDLCALRLTWIRLNMWLEERGRRLVPGVDLVDCLSLYANWLRYTRRVKLAVIGQHKEEQRERERRAENELLLRRERESLLKGQEMAPQEMAPQEMERKSGRKMALKQQAKRRVDTSSLNALKVVALVWIIAGHCVFYLGSTISNGAHLKLYLPTLVTFALSNGAIYITELFFIITGCLSAYLAFKCNTRAFESKSNSADDETRNNLSHSMMELTERRQRRGNTVRDEPSNDETPSELLSSSSSSELSSSSKLRTVTGKGTYSVDVSTSAAAAAADSNSIDNRRANRQPPTSIEATRSRSEINAQIGGGRSSSRSGSSSDNEEHNEQQCNYQMDGRIFSAPFWLLLLANRYLRIMPTYALVYGLVKLISVYAGGSGQLWDYAVSNNSLRRHCVQESWTPVLTLTSNFVNIYRHCIVGGWYLSVDFQFALMSVPLLILLARCQRARRPCHQKQAVLLKVNGNSSDSLVKGAPTTTTATKAAAHYELAKLEIMTSTSVPSSNNSAPPGAPTNDQKEKHYVAQAGKRTFLVHLLLFGLACLSALLASIYLLLWSKTDLSYLIKFAPHTMSILSQNITMYTNPLQRFRAYAVGLIIGHALYLYEFKLITLHKFIQRHGSKLSVATFSIGASIMFIPVLYPMGKLIISHDIMAILMVLSAGGIDIFLGALIFLICINKAPKVALFVLNSPYWSLLSTLSLSAFLIHAEIIIILTSQLDPPPSVSYSLLFFVFSATILLTYSLALALYLAFEMPVSRLIESVMRHSPLVKENMKKRKKSRDNEEVEEDTTARQDNKRELDTQLH